MTSLDSEPQSEKLNRFLGPRLRILITIPIVPLAFLSPELEAFYMILLFCLFYGVCDDADIGIRTDTLFAGIKRSWHFFIISLVVSPLIVWMLLLRFLPSFWNHVFERVGIGDLHVHLLIGVLIGPFIEEVVFRGVVQEQIHRMGGSFGAVIVSSMMFAIVHWASGESVHVAVDLILVFHDSLWFGLIYMGSRNTILSYLAHSIGNLIFLAFAVMVVGVTV